MNGSYLPQQLHRARSEGRLLGQVRDLLVMRKPAHEGEVSRVDFLFTQQSTRSILGTAIAEAKRFN